MTHQPWCRTRPIALQGGGERRSQIRVSALLFITSILALTGCSQHGRSAGTGSRETSSVAAPLAPLPPPYVCLRNFHVSTTGTNSSSCGSVGSPCATIQGANDNIALTGGDCVNVAAGTYNVGGTNLTRGGTSASQDSNGKLNGYVTYVGAPNHATILKAVGGYNQDFRSCGANGTFGGAPYYFVKYNANYLWLDSFEFDGNHAVEYTSLVLGGDGAEGGNHALQNHHNSITNSLIHGSGGAGIQASYSDYFFIANNEIYDTSKTDPCHDSGISVGFNTNLYNFTASLPYDTQRFHIFVLNNIVHDNFEGPNIPGPTDGNGIIFDSSDNVPAPNSGPNGNYQYESLVAGNVVYNNGAGGLYSLASNGITWSNNIAYNNGLKLGRGDCSVLFGGTNVSYNNNICYATAGNLSGIAFEAHAGNPLGVTLNNNLTFGGGNNFDRSGVTLNNNKFGVDPALTNISAGDFHPLAGSPVLNAGTAFPWGYVLLTPDGVLQPTPPNIGAYILAGGPPPPPTFPLRIASGSSSNLTDASGNVWNADTGYTGGLVYGNAGHAVQNTTSPQLYDNQRYGAHSSGSPASFSYSFNAPAGKYSVTLKFAESWVTAAGQRQFNVLINGQQVLTNFDIFAASGGMWTAIDKTFPVTLASAGAIQIAFAPGAAQSPKVDAIEIDQLITFPLRIASGSSSNVTDADGNVWSADSGSTGGLVFGDAGHAVRNTTSPQLYDNQRYGAGSSGSPASFSYSFNAPAGNYSVTLKFTESWVTAASQRQFNVLINGQQVLTNFDIFAASGAMWTAIDKTFPVSLASAGAIQIVFAPGTVQSPKVDAIEVDRVP